VVEPLSGSRERRRSKKGLWIAVRKSGREDGVKLLTEEAERRNENGV